MPDVIRKTTIHRLKNILSKERTSDGSVFPATRSDGVEIASTEHAPLTYTLSKNAETGAITIHYSEPEGLPVHFHWETTIATDGSTTSTAMEVEP